MNSKQCKALRWVARAHTALLGPIEYNNFGVPDFAVVRQHQHRPGRSTVSYSRELSYKGKYKWLKTQYRKTRVAPRTLGPQIRQETYSSFPRPLPTQLRRSIRSGLRQASSSPPSS